MEGMKLYELAYELENFPFEIDEETGLILNADELDQLEMEFKDKVENCCLFVKNLKAELQGVETEKKYFAEREKKLKNKISSMESYIKKYLKGNPFNGEKCSVTFRKSVQTIVPEDITKLPKKYLRVKYEADKTAIKEALNDNKKVAGCYLADNISMTIK